MPNDLNAQGMALLRVLEDHLQEVKPDDPATFITYAEVHKRLRLPKLGRDYGASLQVQGLNSLASWTGAHGFPKIEGLIVRDRERSPGGGFWHSNKKDEVADFQWWLNEISEAKRFDWSWYSRSTDGRLSDSVVPIGSHESLTIKTIRRDKPLLYEESRRIASLVFSRVTASGEIFERRAPLRSAPADLILRIAQMLCTTPLCCALCGGLMYIRPKNILLKPSPDRIDSQRGEYGPNNFQLTHLACNLAKNRATADEFHEWFRLAIEAQLSSKRN